MALLLFYYLTSHTISFICSILEAVLLCCTHGYVTVLQKKRPVAGRILADLKGRIDRPLAAILTLNTAAHTFGAAGVGGQVVELYGDRWLALVTVFLTMTMLFVTEMIPKTLGALYWKQLAPPVAYCIRFLIAVTYPFVRSFEWVARWLSRGKAEERVTEEEVRWVLEEGTRTGIIKEVEHGMVESIFRLGNRRVNVLMTPRMEIEWIDISVLPEALQQQLKQSPHSRFPVCEGELDHVVGFLTARTLLQYTLTRAPLDLRALVAPPLFVPESMRVVQLLDLFKTMADPIALVTNEYGGIQGIVTLHDVLESIIGTMPAFPLAADQQTTPDSCGPWIVEGMCPIDEFKAQFDIDHLPEEEKGAYRTVGGLCMQQIGEIPKTGDSFVWREFRFEIVSMEGRRVEKVKIHLATL